MFYSIWTQHQNGLSVVLFLQLYSEMFDQGDVIKVSTMGSYKTYCQKQQPHNNVINIAVCN